MGAKPVLKTVGAHFFLEGSRPNLSGDSLERFQKDMPHYSTFVVRILIGDDNSVVEGQITHVASQKTAYFRDLSKAIDFIEHNLDSNSEAPHEGTSSGTTVLP